MASEGDAWDQLSSVVDSLFSSVKKVAAVAVNSTSVKDEAREAVQFYFRTARPTIVVLGVEDDELAALDGEFQTINDLSQGNNRKKTYLACLKKARIEISNLAIRRHKLAGTRSLGGELTLSAQQAKIIKTLQGMLPTSAASFTQALRDLADDTRLSFRGPAAELRETLREVIDHLAPDASVIAVPGFKFEKDQYGVDRTTPTLKQKVRFIWRSRNRGSAATSTAENTVAIVDSGPDNLARSIYNQGSAATHTSQDRKQVLGIGRYTEVILADLLEID